MDLAVDENGLWVLWGSTGNSYRLYASKINVQKNSITHTWSLDTGMSTLNRFLGSYLMNNWRGQGFVYKWLIF